MSYYDNDEGVDYYAALTNWKDVEQQDTLRGTNKQEILILIHIWNIMRLHKNGRLGQNGANGI